MPINVQCQACGKHYDIPDDYVGRKGRCGGCGAVLVIGDISQPDPPAPADPAFSMPPARPAPQTAPAAPALASAVQTAPAAPASSRPVDLDPFIPLAPEPTPQPARRTTSASSSNRSDSGRYVPKIVVAPPSIISDTDAVPAPSLGRARQSGEAFRFYKSHALDRRLPQVALFIYLIAAVLVVLSRSWYVPLGFILLTSLALPLARFGAGLGSRLIGYPMPERPFARIATVMSMPILLNYALKPLMPGLLGHLLGGWLVGLFPAFFAFWFLYRPRCLQALKALLLILALVLPVVYGVFYSLTLLLAAAGQPWH